MQAFVITLTQIPESAAASNLAIASATKFGLKAQVFDAITRDKAPIALKKDNLECRSESNNHGDFLAVMGCFMSHFTLWKKCIELNEPIIILEHDAIVYSEIPLDLLTGTICTNIGKPSYGRKKKPKLNLLNKVKNRIFGQRVIQTLFSKKCIPGNHGYYLEPAGAKLLVEGAHKLKFCAADLFMNKQDFPFIKEIYPWAVTVETNFSTIQHDVGITRQHSFENSDNSTGSYKTADSFWES
jgi:glycosyl transferase family 25